MSGYFITGTDTGVGKTTVTACLAALLRKNGTDVGVMKPLETGVDLSRQGISDAEFLMWVSGVNDPLPDVSPYRFKTAAAPYPASQIEGRVIDPEIILKSFRQLATRHDLMLVEGIGGLLVPITRDYLVADLVADLQLPLIVVSRFALGTLNHTLLTLHAAKTRGLEICGIIFNHCGPGNKTPIELRNPQIVEKISGTRILGECPYIENVSPESFSGDLLSRIEAKLNFL